MFLIPASPPAAKAVVFVESRIVPVTTISPAASLSRKV
jgi:hypothetical protein